MTLRYYKTVKDRIDKLEWLVERVSTETEYDEDAGVGIMSGCISFKDGSTFHFKDVLLGNDRHYRFHYTDKENNLIARWDNAPHYKGLKSFPYHVHLPDGVEESKRITLVDVLAKIERMVIEKLESGIE